MFSKAIFKQTFKQNWKLWAVFTSLTAIIGAVFIAIFDPQTMQGMTEMIEGTSLASLMGERLNDFTSILGLLGENFYGGILGCILPVIYVIMTCNTLVASQVDRGSMAYILSTPIKRSKVIMTQAIYMIGSLFLMFCVVIIVGLGSLQIFHHGLWGEEYTADVSAIAEKMDKSQEYIKNNIPYVLENEDALKVGAEARNIDVDTYQVYLDLKMEDEADQAVSKVLDIDKDDVSKHLKDVLNNKKALKAGAKKMHMSVDEYKMSLTQKINMNTENVKQQKEAVQKQFYTALSVGANSLDVDLDELKDDLSLLKNDEDAMKKASNASGLSEEMIKMAINQQLANSQLSLDEGIDFNIKDYIVLNLGSFLLMFAYSGISFMFSCIFNLTKYSLGFGAGLPIASILFYVMSITSSDLEFLKYVSLNTFYNTSAIVNGGSYASGLFALLLIGIILYFIGGEVFTRKDLPL